MITAEELLDQVREKGGRITTARRLVVSTLLDATGHITAEELAATIRRSIPKCTRRLCTGRLIPWKLGIVENTHVGTGRRCTTSASRISISCARNAVP